jgi:hypothetical protein
MTNACEILFGESALQRSRRRLLDNYKLYIIMIYVIIYIILVLYRHTLIHYNEPQLNKLLFYFM